MFADSSDFTLPLCNYHALTFHFISTELYMRLDRVNEILCKVFFLNVTAISENHMMKLFLIVSLAVLSTTAPTQAGHYQSLEPGEDGVANVASFIQAATANKARYARAAKRASNISDQTTTFNITTVYVENVAIESGAGNVKEKRVNGGPILPPIYVPLATKPYDFYPEGEYVGASSVGSEPNHQRVTRFDTVETDYLIPSKRCAPADGCAGIASDKYQEGGQNSIVSKKYLSTCSLMLLMLTRNITDFQLA